MTATLSRPKPPFTTERFYLEHVNQHRGGMAMLMRHVNRYKWAASHLTNADVVLDAGCGSGYGDHILLNAAKAVVGVDQSSEAIEYARWKAAKLHQNRVRFEQQPLQSLSLESLGLAHPVDGVVCIEVIEHLKTTDQDAFMESLKKILRPEGLLLITTPRKNETTGALKTEFHEDEFTEESFLIFLGRFFLNVHFDVPMDFKIPPDFMLAVCSGVMA